MTGDSAIALEWFLGLYTTAQVALVGAVIYLHVRFARVESALSHPEFGIGVILKDLVRRVGDLESAKRR